MATAFAMALDLVSLARRRWRALIYTAFFSLLAGLALAPASMSTRQGMLKILPFGLLGLAKPVDRRRPAKAAASYCRLPSSRQDEPTLETQQKEFREAAARDGHEICSDLAFFNRAEYSAEPDGLKALIAAAEAGKFRTLYLYSLSCLAPQPDSPMAVLQRLVTELQIRVVAIS